MAILTKLLSSLDARLMSFGFILMAVAGLIKILKPEKLTAKETASLFHKGLNYIFILGLLIIVVTLIMTVSKEFISKSGITLVTKNNQGTTLQAVGDINQGVTELKEDRNTQKPASKADQRPTNIKQSSEGNTGTVYQSGGDINVR